MQNGRDVILAIAGFVRKLVAVDRPPVLWPAPSAEYPERSTLVYNGFEIVHVNASIARRDSNILLVFFFLNNILKPIDCLCNDNTFMSSASVAA